MFLISFCACNSKLSVTRAVRHREIHPPQKNVPFKMSSDLLQTRRPSLSKPFEAVPTSIAFSISRISLSFLPVTSLHSWQLLHLKRVLPLMAAGYWKKTTHEFCVELLALVSAAYPGTKLSPFWLTNIEALQNGRENLSSILWFLAGFEAHCFPSHASRKSSSSCCVLVGFESVDVSTFM